jgi:hypothetical protein
MHQHQRRGGASASASANHHHPSSRDSSQSQDRYSTIMRAEGNGTERNGNERAVGAAPKQNSSKAAALPAFSRLPLLRLSTAFRRSYLRMVCRERTEQNTHSPIRRFPTKLRVVTELLRRQRLMAATLLAGQFADLAVAAAAATMPPGPLTHIRHMSAITKQPQVT